MSLNTNPSEGRTGLFDPFAQAVAPIPVPAEEEGVFGMPVYWPGDRPLIERFDSKTYVFAPKEVKIIYPRRGHQIDAKGRLLMDRPLRTRIAAEEVVEALRQKAERKGLVTQTGNPAVDLQRNEEGRKRYMSFRKQECESILAQHELDCIRALDRKATPPRPSKAWHDAKIDLKELGRIVDGRKRFICLKDGMDFATESQAITYIMEEYPGTDPKTVIQDNRPNTPKPTDEQAALVAAVAAAPDPVAPAPIVRSVQVADEVTQIFLRSAMEGITLPAEIRENLKSDDSDIRSIAVSDALTILDGPQG